MKLFGKYRGYSLYTCQKQEYFDKREAGKITANEMYIIMDDFDSVIHNGCKVGEIYYDGNIPCVREMPKVEVYCKEEKKEEVKEDYYSSFTSVVDDFFKSFCVEDKN